MDDSKAHSKTPTSTSGKGRIELRPQGSEVAFSALFASYPLKLLSPRIPQNNVAIVYTLTYGGGLVGGDNICLSVEVHSQAMLVLLSQGSTKVFKTRPDRRLSSHTDKLADPTITTQKMDVTLHEDSSFFLLPDPVTCFRAAKYHQLQTFRLIGNASVVLLDWITSGRRALGEDWQFSEYYSLNEVWIDGERVARDAMLLEEQRNTIRALPVRSLADILAPYSCYATIIMYGPRMKNVIQQLSANYRETILMKQSLPQELLWSLSLLREGQGCIVRVAAKETEDVRYWLRDALKDLEDTVGTDTYRKAFGG